MYEALLRKDTEFEGQFFAAIKTTGIFCRPSCTARKPKRENVEYFRTQREAMVSGYRPCKVCRPLSYSREIPAEIKSLINEINSNPSLKISDYDLRKRELEPSRIRRWFQKNHGVTFQGFQRLMRINNAFHDIKNGDKVINAAFENGYGSLSGFNYSFKKNADFNPNQSGAKPALTFTRFTTPLGPMMAVATEKGLCLLEFTDRRMLETQLKNLEKHYRSKIFPGKSKFFPETEKQMNEYFAGKRKDFDVPLVMTGSDFQKSVWKILQTIPYGQTRSYKKQAELLGNPKAVRAVANANGKNGIAIMIPCHRVIGEDGKLTGYGGGLWRKKWLIDLEKS
ncbi:MAG: bifunctional transcriptional activator/DNA repair protein Ada [Bacteroidetes bacterium]|nr:bifunctional transcriptional activator/DNA repair protein Ada [Bacteroidota bacterium]